MVMKSMFEAHKKDKPSLEQADMMADMKEQLEVYLNTRKTESANKAKAIAFSKQIGLNTATLSEEEWRVLIKVLQSSHKMHGVKKRKWK